MEIYFYEIIFEIQTRNIFAKVIWKMSVIRPGFNEQGWALRITCELSLTFRLVIMNFILVVMYMYILVPGASFTNKGKF